MYSVEVLPPTAVMADIQRTLSQSPKLMAVAYKRATSRLKSRWLKALRVEPPPAQGFYPIKWKTRKQQRAFFASDGFGRGIPTARTHELVKAWNIEIATAEQGGAIIVGNPNPAAGFVYGNELQGGDPRQPMFDPALGGIPWLDPDEVNFKFQDEAALVLYETWFTVSDPTAGVRP